MISLHKSRVGPKGQITIPKELRDRYHLMEGEEVIIIPSEDGILIKHPKAALRGSLKGKLDLKGIENDVRKLRSQWRL
jgi:AbrB family looped-hinge helix DNA binding protein